MTHLFVNIYLFICFMHIGQIRGDHLVTVYDYVQFGGESYTVDMKPGRCYDFSFFNDRISSINSHGHCVNLYADRGCRGDSLTIRPGSASHNDLRADNVDFNDKTSSLRFCEMWI